MSQQQRKREMKLGKEKREKIKEKLFFTEAFLAEAKHFQEIVFFWKYEYFIYYMYLNYVYCVR